MLYVCDYVHVRLTVWRTFKTVHLIIVSSSGCHECTKS